MSIKKLQTATVEDNIYKNSSLLISAMMNFLANKRRAGILVGDITQLLESVQLMFSNDSEARERP